MNQGAAHSRLVAECLEELALMGYAAWPNRTGAAKIDGRFIRFGKKGSGDVFALLPTLVNGSVYGIHAEFECKQAAAYKAPFRTHMRIVRNNGGIYVVVKAKEDVARSLAALGFQLKIPHIETIAAFSTGLILLLQSRRVDVPGPRFGIL